MAKAKAKATQKKRKVNVESIGEAHVTASFNNIIVSLTNKKGDEQGENADSTNFDVDSSLEEDFNLDARRFVDLEAILNKSKETEHLNARYEKELAELTTQIDGRKGDVKPRQEKPKRDNQDKEDTLED